MIALVAATEREARPLLTGLGAVEIGPSPFPAWRAAVPTGHKEVRLVVSGVGKVAAAAASASLLARPGVDWLINVGICGVLVDRADLAPAALCQVMRAVEGDRLGMGDRPADPVGCRWLEGAGMPAVDLVTVDRPVFDAWRRASLAARGQVVDMEGAAVARTAAWFGIPCTLIKGISDSAGGGDRGQLLTRLDGLAEALGRKVLEILHQPETEWP